MKLLIAAICLLCMIVVPIQCDNMKCKFENKIDFGKEGQKEKKLDSGRTASDGSNPLCGYLKKQAENMAAAGVCNFPTPAPGGDPKEVAFTKKVLEDCGNDIPSAADLNNQQNKATTKTKIVEALTCATKHPACEVFTGTKGTTQALWRGKMDQCLNMDKKPPAECLSIARPLDCTAGKQGYLCNVFKEVWNTNCQPDITQNKLDECQKKWPTPTQLGECYLKLKCTGEKSKQQLETINLKKCYDDQKYDIKEDATEDLKNKLNKCFEDNDNALTTKSPNALPTTLSTTQAPAPANTNNPSDQGQNEATPGAPQGKDVTSGEEDEGCMVRANEKIIIAIAATFVAINFLKALPVEN